MIMLQLSLSRPMTTLRAGLVPELITGTALIASAGPALAFPPVVPAGADPLGLAAMPGLILPSEDDLAAIAPGHVQVSVVSLTLDLPAFDNTHTALAQVLRAPAAARAWVQEPEPTHRTGWAETPADRRIRQLMMDSYVSQRAAEPVRHLVTA